MSKSKKQKLPDLPFGSPPELIVVSKSVEAPHAEEVANALRAESKPALKSLAGFIVSKGLSLTPLFAGTDAEVASIVSRAASDIPGEDFSTLQQYYKVDAPEGTDLEALAKQLYALAEVEAAYVKPPAQPPIFFEADESNTVPGMEDQAPIVQDLTPNQGYLNAAPQGVDARYSWTVPGGRGAGVRIIDIEGGWNFAHEDLRFHVGGLLGGVNSADMRWRNHGTAVIGEMIGNTNGFGITGISPDANVRTFSIFNGGSANALRTAADNLSAGDVILIELHRGGPRYPGGDTQLGFIAIEFWPDDFEAIRYATSKGVIVIEAAGNGSQNLDDAIYDTRPAGFPATWRNPFRRAAGVDSGAILVGAGAPPPGTNGGNWGVDRSRLGFSNFGAAVDTQGWGQGVTTTGYGVVTGTDPNNQNEWYTNFFNGTSSASPIVTAVVADLQGVQKAAGRTVLTPRRVRELLRTTGSPQQAGANPVSQRIGNRPNLRALIQAVSGGTRSWVGVQFTGVIAANGTGRWFTHSWPDHWHVIWTVVPTAPAIDGPEQIEFKVKTTRQAFGLIKYFIEIKNLRNYQVTIEARFAVLAS